MTSAGHAAVGRDEVTVGGVRTPLLTSGAAGAREAVVFVHGVPGPGIEWTDLLARVAPFARGIAPDMPGYGGASGPRSFDYTIEGYARHLDGVLQATCVDRVHLVAHDFGGAWALAWAALRPAALASATLVDTGILDASYRWHRYARIWRTPVVGELFQAASPRPAFRLLVGRENPRLSRDAVDALHRASHGRGTTRAILKLYRSSPVSAMRGPVELLRSLDRPALVLWGEDDRYLPSRLAAVQREAFPSASIEVLPGHGHWVHLEAPDVVAQRVVPFLREQLGEAKASELSAAVGGP